MNLPAHEFGALILRLLVLLAAAHLLGSAFRRLRQPRVVGEILAGLVFGPTVLGQLSPALSQRLGPPAADGPHAAVLGFLFNLGLVLLMFASGAEARNLFRTEDRRGLAWLAGIGTGLP